MGANFSERESFKSYGGYSSAKFIQKVCSIEAEGKKYSFDVSGDFPDFESSTELLSEIEMYREIIREPVRRRSIKSWWTRFDWY